MRSQWEAIRERLPVKQSSQRKVIEQAFLLGAGVAFRNLCHLLAAGPTETQLMNSVDDWIQEINAIGAELSTTTEAL